MHCPAMGDVRLSAELFPDGDRITRGRGNVGWDICVLVPQGLIPTVLVDLANVITRGIMVVLAEIKAVDPAVRSVEQDVAQGARERIVCAAHEQGIAEAGNERAPELQRRRVVLVFLPHNIADDFLRGIIHDLGKLGVAHRGLLAPDGQAVVAQSAAIMRRRQSENERRWRERLPAAASTSAASAGG